MLDPAAEVLQLRLKHVDLLSIPVRARLGRPLRTGDGGMIWPAVACTLTTQVAEPERPLLRPPQRAGSDTTAAPALSVEDIQAARDRFMLGLPARYRLAFEPGLVVEIVGEAQQNDVGSRWRRAGRGLASAWRDLLHRTSVQHLELWMSEGDARRLYLALTPRMTLLITPVPPQHPIR